MNKTFYVIISMLWLIQIKIDITILYAGRGWNTNVFILINIKETWKEYYYREIMEFKKAERT